jgi:ribosome-associated translation inhibitor RaiA
MSARESIAEDIREQLINMSDPAPGLVTREFFEFEKLAITQYPAILIVTGNEERTDVTLSERQGILQVELRCWVRGNELDTKRNEIIEKIEQTLEGSRGRNITVNKDATHYVETRVTNVEVIERNPPIGQVIVTVEVEYMYKRGNA